MLRARAVAFVAFEETKPLVLNEDLSVASEHSGDIAFNKLYGFIDPPHCIHLDETLQQSTTGGRPMQQKFCFTQLRTPKL